MLRLLVLLCLLSSISLAQDMDTTHTPNRITSASKLIPGVYQTFQQFKTNNPGNTSGYGVKNQFRHGLYDGIPYRRLFRSDSASIPRREMRRAWGFCHNDSIFISTSFLDPTGDAVRTDQFPSVHMMHTGRYCYFELSQPNNNAVVAGSIVGGAIGGLAVGLITSGMDRRRGYVINMNNGGTFELTDKVLLMILAKDPEIQEIYQAQKKQFKGLDINWRTERMEALLKYNARHAEEIKW